MTKNVSVSILLFRLSAGLLATAAALADPAAGLAAAPSAGKADRAAAGGEAEAAVSLPAGETFLCDVGTYRVWWQSYGKEPVAMPPGYSGHFTDASGITYTDWGRLMGRRALLMHSPWRVPTGKTWVDYRLALPHVKPIRLSFGIAMGPDVATPDKSDGVTFSCCLTAGGQTKELLRRHYAQAQWVDYAFDLSDHAGKTVDVRLQVEPGPANNSSFDYSFFGDAKIIVGQVKDNRADLVRRWTESRAYRAVARSSLERLSNEPKNNVTPSNLLPCKNTLERSEGATSGRGSIGDTWRLGYEGEDCRMVYTYRPATGTLDDFTIQVDDGRPFAPALRGGATMLVTRSGKSQEVPARGGKPVKIDRDGDTLRVLWEYPREGAPLRIAWQFQIVGKALVVAARCDEPAVSSFSLGDVGSAPVRKTLPVPYLSGRLNYLPAAEGATSGRGFVGLFACRYLDWTVSHASMCPQGVATYEPKTDGVRNPLIERGYIAVSPHVDEVLPNIPHPPSPHLALLGPRIMLDLWGHHNGTYQGDAESLLALKDHGVDHLAIISHVWQRYGYDVKLPDHLPANPDFGGDEGMREFGKAANQCGYVWSLHENYIDLYPDAPSYDPAARVLMADGKPSPAWYNAGTKVQSFGLKCNRALEFAKKNAPEAHRRFGTTAAYLDVHTCVPPWHQLDHQADQPMAAMALAKVKFDTELFQFMRDTHGGPLFGEGYNHFYWAGRCDGVEAQVDGGEDHACFLDFDLLKIHPQMVNHGMGYYERWFRRGYEHRWGQDTGTMEQIDKYRAQEIAYGHAGFIGAAQVDNIPWVVREHHLVHPVQRLYGASKPVEILYEVDGQTCRADGTKRRPPDSSRRVAAGLTTFGPPYEEGHLVGASVALAVGETSRQRIRYQGGLTLWVNWRAEPWQVEGRVLPQWGFLAKGPGTEVYTAIQDGKYADYAECPEYVFADARTWFPMPYLNAKKDIEPRLRSFEYLDDNRARVTYEWIVNDTLDRDCHCFVHGVRTQAPNDEGIEFQQDHGLPKPTSQWRKGETIVDGPYELGISGKSDAYDLVIGLHKGERVQLKGLDRDANRILIARLKLKREGGKVVGITAEKIDRAAKPKDAAEPDFTARLNSPGTWIDFGKVATDGSVKINRQADRLVVFPYPREKPFRVVLDVKALSPAVDTAGLQIRALAAGTQRDLGPAEFQWQDGRLTLTVGKPGAGRYVIAWKSH
jgi:hypothetical protein